MTNMVVGMALFIIPKNTNSGDDLKNDANKVKETTKWIMKNSKASLLMM